MSPTPSGLAAAPAGPPRRRGRPAALWLAALFAAAPLVISLSGCDVDIQKVDETVPSGRRPAPLPKIDRASAARQAETPAEGEAQAGEAATAEAAPAAGTGGQRGAGAEGEARTGHLRLAGRWSVDAPAIVTCGTFMRPGLAVGFDAPGAPHVELRISDFLGTGEYAAEVLVEAPAKGSGVLQSGGAARATVEVRRVELPRVTTLLYGSLSGSFAGAAGEGTVAGSFAPCRFDGPLP